MSSPRSLLCLPLRAAFLCVLEMLLEVCASFFITLEVVFFNFLNSVPASCLLLLFENLALGFSKQGCDKDAS